MISELKKNHLFESFSDSELKKFAEIITIMEYRGGELIFGEGEAGDSIYIIKSGKVEIKKMIDWKEKRSKTLAVISAGSFFGEMALYSGDPRSAFAYALTDATCYKIMSDDFMKLMTEDSKIGYALSHSIIRIMSERLRNTSRDVVVFFDTGKIIGEIFELTELLSRLAGRLKEMLSAEASLILLYNDLSGDIEVKAFSGISFMPEEIKVEMGHGIIGKVFQTAEPVVSRDKTDDEKLYALLNREYDIQSVMCIPLIAGRHSVIGAILLAEDSGNYGDPEVNLLMGVSRQIATAVENARLNLENTARKEYKRVYIQPQF